MDPLAVPSPAVLPASIATTISTPPPASTPTTPSRTTQYIRIPVELTTESLPEVLNQITEIRERVEMMHTSQYSSVLDEVFPAIERILSPSGIAVSLSTQDQGHRIRFKSLEILNRLPLNDVLRPKAKRLNRICIDVLKRDNEENAIIALKILFEVHKAFGRQVHESDELLEVQPFLDCVDAMYRDLPATLQAVFNPGSLACGGSSSDHLMHNDSMISRDSNYTMLTAMHSFRVMTECPIIVMLLLNLNKSFIKSHVPVLMPKMLAALTARVPAAAFDDASERVAQVRQYRFECMCLAQIKTLSFLTYLLLEYGDLMKPYEADMTSAVIALLRIVPSEAVLTRKELLVAMRHMLSSSFHKGFAAHLNTLLDEKVLLGTPGGRIELARQYPESETPPVPDRQAWTYASATPRLSVRVQPLLALAYSALQDLVQTMRQSMTLPQLSKLVYLFSRNVHDNTLGLGAQNQSVRLLLNLVDSIYHHADAAKLKGPVEARGLLVKILDCLMQKLGTLRHLIPKIISAEKERDKHAQFRAAPAAPMRDFFLVRTNAAGAEEGEIVKVPVHPQGHVGVYRRRIPPLSESASDPSEDEHAKDRAYILGFGDDDSKTTDLVKDAQQMVRTIVMGLQTVFFCITAEKKAAAAAVATAAAAAAAAAAAESQSQQTPPRPPGAPAVLNDDEVRLMSRVFVWSLQCLPIFRLADEAEEIEVLDLLAQAFGVIEPATFIDVLARHIDFFHVCMLRSRRLVRVAQHFLRSPALSRAFCTVIFPFLGSRLALLSGRYGSQTCSLEEGLDRPRALLGEATWIGGNRAWPLDTSHVPSSEPDAAASLEGLGVRPRGSSGPQPTADEEAALISRLLKSALQTMVSAAKLSPPQPGSHEALAAILSAYLEPMVIACLAQCAEATGSSLASLRYWPASPPPQQPTLSSNPHEDAADNAALLLRSILTAIFDCPQEVRDSAAPPMRRLANPIARGVNRLLQCLGADRVVRRDALAEVCVLLSASLANEEALLALPLSVALQAYKHGNEALVSKVLTIMERLVPNGVFQRIALARGGLVMSALQCLVGDANPRFSPLALKLLGKMPAQSVIYLRPQPERGVLACARQLLVDCMDAKEPASPALAQAKRDALAVLLEHGAHPDALTGLICAAADHDLKHPLQLPPTPDVAAALVKALGSGCAARALVVAGLLPGVADMAAPLLRQACLDKAWETRLGACFGVRVLAAKAPADWPMAALLLPGVVHVLRDHDDEMGLDVQTQAGEALAALLARFAPPRAAQLLVEAMHCDDARSRAILRQALLKTPLEAVKVDLSRFDSAALYETTAFLLETSRLDGAKVDLAAVWARACEDADKAEPDSDLVIKDGFPFSLQPPHACLRAAVAWLFRALLAHSKVDVSRLVPLLAQWTTSVWPAVSSSAQAALAAGRGSMDTALGQAAQAQVAQLDALAMFPSLPMVRGLRRTLEAVGSLVPDASALPEAVFKALTRDTNTGRADGRLPGDEIEIYAGLIELLSYTPSAPSLELVEKAVTFVLKLEMNFHVLQQTHPRQLGCHVGARLSSPLRAPLARLLARAPGLALQMFLQRVFKRAYSGLLSDMLGDKDQGAALRAEIENNHGAFADCFLRPKLAESEGQNTERARSTELRFLYVRLLRSCVKWSPQLLVSRPQLVEGVAQLLSMPDHEKNLSVDEIMPVRHRTFSRLACKCIMAAYCAGGPVEPLQELISVSVIRSTFDTTFISDFFAHTLAEHMPFARQREAVDFFVGLLPKTKPPVDEAVVRLVLIPLLSAMYLKRAEVPVVTPSSLEGMVQLILAAKGEEYEVQMLQLASLLIAHAGRELMGQRKEIIKWAWNHISKEDSPSRYWSYVCVCTFIDVYATPADIILQVYVAVLRTHNSDARELVCKALDLLTPALPRRLEMSKYIKVLKWTKKLLFDDGHQLPQLTHIWNMVTRHPQLFYQYRAQFIPQMVNSLDRIGLPHNCPIENRELAVNLAELILTWECTREVEEKMPVVDVPRSSTPREDAVKAFRINATMIKIVLHFLMRVALQMSEARDQRGRSLSVHCIKLFKQGLDLVTRRIENKVVLSLFIIAKPLSVHVDKIKAMAEQEVAAVKAHFAEPAQASKPAPRSAWERRLDPGAMCCALDLLTLIALADRDLVAGPFVAESGADLHCILTPALSSPERGVEVKLAKLLVALLMHHPLNSKVTPLNFDNAVPGNPPLGEPLLGKPRKPFYPTLANLLNRRLILVTEDFKRVDKQQQQQEGKKSTTRGQKEAAQRQVEQMGGGLRGTLVTVKLLQVLCASTLPVPFEGLSNAGVGSASAADKFAPSLLRVLQKLVKEVAEKRFGSEERIVALQVLEVVLVLLDRAKASGEVRKALMQSTGILLDKLEVTDEAERFVRMAGGWIGDASLSAGETRQLWDWLQVLDVRLGGLPGAYPVRVALYELMASKGYGGAARALLAPTERLRERASLPALRELVTTKRAELDACAGAWWLPVLLRGGGGETALWRLCLYDAPCAKEVWEGEVLPQLLKEAPELAVEMGVMLLRQAHLPTEFERGAREAKREQATSRLGQGLLAASEWRALERQWAHTAAGVLAVSLMGNLPGELARFLGRAHGCEHSAVEALEGRWREAGNQGALLGLLEDLDEWDAHRGLLGLCSGAEGVQRGVRLEEAARWGEARAAYLSAMRSVAGEDPASGKRVARCLDAETTDAEEEQEEDFVEDAVAGGAELRAWERRVQQCGSRLGEWGLAAALELGDQEWEAEAGARVDGLRHAPALDKGLLKVAGHLRRGGSASEAEALLQGVLKELCAVPGRVQDKVRLAQRVAELDEAVHVRGARDPARAAGKLAVWKERGPSMELSVGDWAAVTAWRADFARVLVSAEHDQVLFATFLQGAAHARRLECVELARKWLARAWACEAALGAQAELSAEALRVGGGALLSGEDAESRRLLARRVADAAEKEALLVEALRTDGKCAAAWLDWGRLVRGREGAACVARAMGLGLYAASAYVFLLLDGDVESLDVEQVPAGALLPWLYVLLGAGKGGVARSLLEKRVAAYEPQALMHALALWPNESELAGLVRRLHAKLGAEFDVLERVCEDGVGDFKPRVLLAPGTHRRVRRLVVHDKLVEFELDSGRVFVFGKRRGPVFREEMQTMLLCNVVHEILGREGGGGLFCSALTPVSAGLGLDYTRGLQRVDVLAKTEGGLRKWFVGTFARMDEWWAARAVLQQQLAVWAVVEMIDVSARGMPWELLLGRGNEAVVSVGLGGVDALGSERVVFRMTRGMEDMVGGEVGLMGGFASGFCRTARLLAKAENREVLEGVLGGEALRALTGDADVRTLLDTARKQAKEREGVVEWASWA